MFAPVPRRGMFILLIDLLKQLIKQGRETTEVIIITAASLKTN